jgi:hypothetical protein
MSSAAIDHPEQGKHKFSCLSMVVLYIERNGRGTSVPARSEVISCPGPTSSLLNGLCSWDAALRLVLYIPLSFLLFFPFLFLCISLFVVAIVFFSFPRSKLLILSFLFPFLVCKAPSGEHSRFRQPRQPAREVPAPHFFAKHQAFHPTVVSKQGPINAGPMR